jgi:hypothetical protein
MEGKDWFTTEIRLLVNTEILEYVEQTLSPAIRLVYGLSTSSPLIDTVDELEWERLYAPILVLIYHDA